MREKIKSFLGYMLIIGIVLFVGFVFFGSSYFYIVDKNEKADWCEANGGKEYFLQGCVFPNL